MTPIPRTAISPRDLVDDPDVDARNRTTGGLGHHVDRIARTGHGADAGRLGQPVRRHDQRESENVEHVAHEGGWNDRGAGDAHAQRPERVRSLASLLDQRVKEGRRALHDRDPVFGHHPREAVGIEAAHRNRRRARHQARQQSGLVAADV
jgi:hypothetical protein